MTVQAKCDNCGHTQEMPAETAQSRCLTYFKVPGKWHSLEGYDFCSNDCWNLFQEKHKIRRKFEAWALKQGFIVSRSSLGNYDDDKTFFAWEAWREAIK